MAGNEGDYCSVEVVFGKNERDYYHFKKTAEGLKLDWRSSVGDNPVSLPFFRTQRLKGTYLFRVRTKLTDYYNDAEQTHQFIERRGPDGAAITGYVRRDASTAAALLDVLKAGKEHGVMVELRYPPGSKDSSIVGIERFVAERWRQRPEEFVAGRAPAPCGSLPLVGSECSPSLLLQEHQLALRAVGATQDDPLAALLHRREERVVQGQGSPHHLGDRVRLGYHPELLKPVT